MRATALAALFALAALSCAPPGPTTLNNVMTENNVNPVGTIQGRVTDATTGAPLGGVTVTTLKGVPVTKMTDPDGFYAIDGLPGGATYTLIYDLSGYVRSIAAATLAAATGDFPTGNATTTRNVVLAKGTAEVRGYVFAAEGRAASGASVVADLRADGFDLIATARVAADGSFKLTGLPGFAAGLLVSLVVAPYDENADGTPDYGAAYRSVIVYAAAASFVVIAISPTAVSIVSTNLSDGELGVTEPIQVAFSVPMDPEQTTASLRNASRSVDVAVVTSWDPGRITLTVRTAGDAPLGAGQRYQLNLSARSQSGAFLTAGIPFQAVSSPVTPITKILANLKVEKPRPADWDSTIFELSWDAAAEASRYRVYAHDSATNPSWVFLRDVFTSPAPLVTVFLPTPFDTYTGDGYRTPLAFGTTVTFAVVPVDGYGYEAPLSNAAAVTVRDEARPTATAVQTGNAINQSGGSRTFELAVAFDEYMDTAAAPTINLPLAAANATWAWNRGLLSGVFTITVPTNSDARGPYVVSGARDTSGNGMVDLTGTFIGQRELIGSGTFEGTPCTLSGWSATNQAGASTPIYPSPIAQSFLVRNGSCAALVGVSATGTAGFGSSILSQQISLPAQANKIDLVLWYQAATDRPFSSAIQQECEIYDAAGTVYLATVFQHFWGTVRSTWQRQAADLTPFAGLTVTLRCAVTNFSNSTASRSAVYLDDVSIVAHL